MKNQQTEQIQENEVLSFNMGGYIYKVAYKQIDKLDDYADQNDVVHWFRTAKSLWRKVKASLELSKKDEDFISNTDDIINELDEELLNNSGKPLSKSAQEDKIRTKSELSKKLEELEQNIYKGMAKIKMWIPTNKEYNSIEDEFKATF